MLPEMDGFRVCEAIRLENATVPVLFLTAKNTSEDRITGLRKGADDYLTKPFNLEELILRVGILIRRGLQPESARSEEHTSELQSLMRISYAVFRQKNKKEKNNT